MFRKIFLTLLLLISLAEPAPAREEILVVQSARIQPYEDALNGFLSISNSKIKRIILSENNNEDILEEAAASEAPLILAIGHDALSAVKDIRETPVVFIMVLAPQSILSDWGNFHGISMNIAPDRQLDIFVRTISDLNNIGMIYNPESTGMLAAKAHEAALNKGVRLVSRKTSEATEVPSLIQDMSKEIDAFWMIPDYTTMTPEAIEFLLITSLERSIPILAFSEKYTEVGALLSVAVTPYQMGIQAADAARKLMDKDGVLERISFSKTGVITLNMKIAKKLDIMLNESMPAGIKIIK